MADLTIHARSSEFRIQFYVDDDGVPRLIASRRIQAVGPLEDLPSNAPCALPLVKGFDLQQGFLIDTEWLFNKLPWEIADVLLDDHETLSVASMAGPIEDVERERAVLEAAERSAARFGLDPQPVRDWFALQIDLAKAVQRRTPAAAPTLELEAIRPALIRLGERQVRSLLALAAGAVDQPDPEDLEVLAPYLSGAEVERVRAGLERLLAAISSSPR